MNNRYGVILVSKTGEIQEVLLGKNYQKKALLEQIDIETNRYQDMDEFLSALNKTLKMHFKPEKVYIVYKSNHEEKRLQPSFNNSELSLFAKKNLVIKKSKNIPNDLSNDQQVTALTNRLKLYSASPRYSNYIFKGNEFPYHIKELLTAYQEILTSESTTRQYEIDEITKSLRKSISQYSVFRRIIEWEIKMTKSLEKENQTQPQETYEQLELENYLKWTKDSIEEERKIRYEEEREMYEDYISECKSIIHRDKVNIMDQSLRQAYELHKGDINAIIEDLGIEKIASLSIWDRYQVGLSDDLIKRFMK